MSSISKVKVKNVVYDIGGGSEIYIGDEQDAPESTELLIDSEDVDMLGSEVVNTLEGNETDKAPSVKVINDLNTYSTTEQRIGTWVDRKIII